MESTKKNILVLNYEFPPLWWGQANANYYLFKEFQKYPEYNFVLITSSQNTYKREQFSDNIVIYHLDIWKNWNNFQKQSIKELLRYWKLAYIKSKDIIAEDNIDQVLCWSYPSIALWYMFQKKYDIPYIVLLRGSDVPFYAQKWKYLDIFIFRFWAPIFWKNANSVIANSQGLKDLALQAASKQKIEIIPNGVDINYFKPSTHKISNNTIKILWVGRLAQVKSFDILITAVSKIENVKIEIILAWEWPQRDSLTLLAEKLWVSLTLLWQVTKAELLSQYQSADIFCLPSQNEWMSNTLLEAISSWLPVISTDVWWSSELIADNGYIVRKLDITELKEKIEYLIDNPETRKQMWESSRKKAKQYSWAESAKKLIWYL